MKKLWIWIAALAVGILMLLFRMEISRYMADLTALLIVGTDAPVKKGKERHYGKVNSNIS